MSDTLWLAVGLMLVFEGILPFSMPAAWRATMLNLARLSDRQIRLVGFCGLLAGLAVVLLAS
ncbi:DUF2065 domain-containing protein [Chitinilyticum piscinae]|uniref:DUF2065 domain-containing protein n=1 Tax=Chitinilyticum piscinae TaxID=2866724 RepID=A0A8J7FKD2_9NEIS|nr:DUF2065 domain-containing protein [Chitinilyticum piscinae]MBE9609587.1 DUF2065 domain-containing protein [Chitinilyticum piscinae]